jgi:hypothetical protein
MQEVDEKGNISASAAFELARQVGQDREVFWLGLGLVQNISQNISSSDHVDEKTLQKFRALISAVLSLGEHQLALGRKGDFPTAVRYLRDAASRYSTGMDEKQAEAILEAVFNGKTA